MYETSNITVNRDGPRATYHLILFDTCFSSANPATQPVAGRPLTISSLEACSVAAEYYRRNLNVSRNLARYYLLKRAGGRSSLYDKIYVAHRCLMEERQSIHHYIPQLNFLERYYRATNYYINRPSLLNIH